MPSFFKSFLFKLILTVVISIFIGTQLAKVEFKEASFGFRKILDAAGIEEKGDLELEGKIRGFLEGKDGQYAVYVKDLKPEGTRNVYINSDQIFPSASLYKVFLMAAVFEAIDNGEFAMETEISAKIGHLDEVLGAREYGYEEYDKEEFVSRTVKEALERVAMFSDNYSAIMLAEKVGWDSVQDVANEIGALNTTVKTPISTSAEDVGILLEKLYKGEMVSFEASEEMINLLTKAQVNDRIPAKLPKEVKVAHKTGELSRIRNDGGIVFLEGNPYLIVMMSKELKGEDQGVENLAEVSRIVYDYYTSTSD